MGKGRMNFDRGCLYERIQFDPMEAAFAMDWEKLQKRERGSLLKEIVCEHATKRDRYVAASVIQWLGTNVGFGFLTNALQKAGYAVVSENVPYYVFFNCEGGEELFRAMALAEAQKRAAQLVFDLSEPH